MCAMRNPVTTARIAKTVHAASVLPLPVAVRLYRGTDKGEHGYAEPYQRHLGHLRRRRMGVIEIGVGGYAGANPSGSLRLWRDWFPRATVVGVDLHAKRVRLGRRVRFVQGDQSDPAVLDRAVEAAGGSATVVIDDGSHIGEHVVASFRHLFPQLAAGSVYVIEDLHTSYWAEFGGGYRNPYSFIEQAKRLIDLLNAHHTRDPHSFAPTGFTATTGGMHFYDSMLVLDRVNREVPKQVASGKPSFAD